ncbi:hypothetical protein [Nocardiopsis dassonvillei]
MAELISLFALFVVFGLFWFLVGPPFVERRADLETLRKLTGKGARRG